MCSAWWPLLGVGARGLCGEARTSVVHCNAGCKRGGISVRQRVGCFVGCLVRGEGLLILCAAGWGRCVDLGWEWSVVNVAVSVAMRRTLRAVLLCVLCALLMACGSGRYKTQWDGPPKSEAEAAYREGVEMTDSGQYIDATQKFNYVRLKFPYSSRWTTLSELRLADLSFEQSRYLQAAELYAQFVKAHPTHEEVPYALLRAGDCFYEQMPSDIFLLPDPWQRDLNSTRQAADAYQRFLLKYPDHEFSGKARERILEVRERLARHELFVAEFYMKREQPIGALNRLLVLVERYPDVPSMDKGLFLLAHSYIIIGDIEAAARALQRLAQDLPNSPLTPDARDWLAQSGLTDVAPMPIGEELTRQRKPRPAASP